MLLLKLQIQNVEQLQEVTNGLIYKTMALSKKAKASNAREIKKACPHHHRVTKGKPRTLSVQRGRK